MRSRHPLRDPLVAPGGDPVRRRRARAAGLPRHATGRLASPRQDGTLPPARHARPAPHLTRSPAMLGTRLVGTIAGILESPERSPRLLGLHLSFQQAFRRLLHTSKHSSAGSFAGPSLSSGRSTAGESSPVDWLPTGVRRRKPLVLGPVVPPTRVRSPRSSRRSVGTRSAMTISGFTTSRSGP